MDKNETIVLNIHLKNGVQLIGEMEYSDEHSTGILRPIEIRKRPSFGKNGVYEVITTSPFLLMSDSFLCSIPSSEILVRGWLHEDLYEMYTKLASKYYMDVSEIMETDLPDEDKGTMH
jgi:hypothetical protein